MLYFENGVAGGIIRLRAWLNEAKQRYDEDGLAGVLAFVRHSIVTYLVAVKDAIVRLVWTLIRRVKASLGATG